MRRAAPSLWEKKPPLTRSSRWLATLFALGISGACSVYTNDLLEATTGITNGGSDSSGNGGALAGNPAIPGGNSSTAGGNPGTVTPAMGGEGGEPSGSEMAGADSGGATNVAGTAAVAGTGGSDAGGTAASGGSAGSAGSSTNPNLIDDFEDQNLTIKQVDTRGGVWYLFNNGTTGTTGPTPLECSPNSGAPAALGDYAMHITATGFTGTGAVGSGLGVDFRNQRKVYDGSKFMGIRFWGKVGASKNTQHRIQIADGTTDKAGEKCNSAANAPNGEKCDDHFGYDVTLTTAWALYSVPFDELTQLGWGLSADALDKAALYGLQITAAPGAKVDLWLDQIEFF